MEFGICKLSLVALRSEPSDKSEMISQLIFGDFVRIIERYRTWLKVEVLYDNYEGWVDFKQIEIVSDEFCRSNLNNMNIVLKNGSILFNETKNQEVVSVMGSTIPDKGNGFFFINNEKYIYKNEDIFTGGMGIEQIASKYLNSPYFWGGKSPFGIDCSGFTQMVFKFFGILLKRDSLQQAKQGIPVDFLSEVLQGDLAFFDNDEGNIIHVGIVLSDNKIIHASGRVKIDTIDHEGIYSDELKKYTHKLRFIKRVLP